MPFARAVPAPLRPLPAGQHRTDYTCKRCGRPWPDHEYVTRLVAWAIRTGQQEVVLGQPVPEEPEPAPPPARREWNWS